MKTISVYLLSLAVYSSSLHGVIAETKNQYDCLNIASSSAIFVEEYTNFLDAGTMVSSKALFQTNSEIPSEFYDDKMSNQIARQGMPGDYSYQCIEKKSFRPLMSFMNANETKMYCSWKNDFFAGVSYVLKNSKEEIGMIDCLLHSSQMTFELSSPASTTNNSLLKEDDLTWSSCKIFLSACLTIGTLFGEGHFSLEEARRRAPREISFCESLDPRIQRSCFSSQAVRESLKDHHPYARLQAEIELLNNIDHSAEDMDILKKALVIEKNFQEIREKTVFGTLDETRQHLFAGAGRLLGCGFYTLSPILDNGRRFTAGGILGYGSGLMVASLAHGDSFTLMSDGAIGTSLAVGPLLVINIYDIYTHGMEYRSALSERWNHMKDSFAMAQQSFASTWTLQEKKNQITQARLSFYQEQNKRWNQLMCRGDSSSRVMDSAALARIFHTDRDEEAAKADGVRRVVKSDNGCMSPYCLRKTSSSTQHLSGFPGSVVDQCERSELESCSHSTNINRLFPLGRLFLESQAHEVIQATLENQAAALAKFSEMGNQLYGSAIMEHLLAAQKYNENHCEHFLQNFESEKDSLLAHLRSLHVSLFRQWQKSENRSEEDLEITSRAFLITPSLSPQLEWIKNHTEDLRNAAHNEKLEIETKKYTLCKHLTEIGSLVYEGGSFLSTVAMKSLIGFFVGSFIGNEFPITFSEGDLYHPFVAANTTGVAYGAYFLCIDLSNSQNMIRSSARRTTEAYARLSEIFHQPSRQQEVETRLAEAEERWSIAQSRYSENKLLTTFCELKQQFAENDGCHTVSTPQKQDITADSSFKTPFFNRIEILKNSQRNSTMPKTKPRKTNIPFSDEIEEI